MSYKILAAEEAAGTTLDAGSFVGNHKVIRVLNSTGTNATVNVGGTNRQVVTSVNNASLQADIVLDDASALEVGDLVVHANIPPGSVITVIAGNTITLDNNLTGAIDGSGTPVTLETYRDGIDTTVLGNSEIVIHKDKSMMVYASAATVLLTPVSWPR